MHVADGMPGLVRELAAVTDVEPAGIAKFAVDDETLAIVAEVGVGEADRHTRGEESLHASAMSVENADDGGPRIPRADAVDEHADHHRHAVDSISSMRNK